MKSKKIKLLSKCGEINVHTLGNKVLYLKMISCSWRRRDLVSPWHLRTPVMRMSSFVWLLVVKCLGTGFGGISFVNVIQMLTETFCYHALGFTNIYGITLCTSDGVYDIFSGTAEIVFDGKKRTFYKKVKLDAFLFVKSFGWRLAMGVHCHLDDDGSQLTKI